MGVGTIRSIDPIKTPIHTTTEYPFSRAFIHRQEAVILTNSGKLVYTLVRIPEYGIRNTVFWYPNAASQYSVYHWAVHDRTSTNLASGGVKTIALFPISIPITPRPCQWPLHT